jgi:hypothetical protein
MARFSLIRNVVLALAVGFVAAQGCAKQGEGERCEPLAARNTDCDDGLICVPGDQLLDNVVASTDSKTDFGRCCPPEGEAISDSRCARAGSLSGSGGSSGSSSSGAGGEPGSSGGGGEPAVAGAGGDVSSGGVPSSGGAGGTPAEGGAGGTPAEGGAGGALGGQGGNLSGAGGA